MVVNNGPCPTTRVGKVNKSDSLFPSPSSFFVKFLQGRSSPSGLWSVRSGCNVFVEAFTLFIPAWGVVASTSTWDSSFSRTEHSSAKLLVCLINLSCVWRWSVRAKLISNAAVLFLVSFAKVPPIRRLAWDGICKSSGCYDWWPMLRPGELLKSLFAGKLVVVTGACKCKVRVVSDPQRRERKLAGPLGSYSRDKYTWDYTVGLGMVHSNLWYKYRLYQFTYAVTTACF